MARTELNGVRCVTVVRTALCACPSVLCEQSKHLDDFAVKHGGKVVGRLVLNGVAHGLPKYDLASLLDRKRSANDFEALLLTKPSRLARGAAHGWHIFATLKKASIRIIFTKEAMDRYAGTESFADMAYAFVRQQRRLRRQLHRS